MELENLPTLENICFNNNQINKIKIKNEINENIDNKNIDFSQVEKNEEDNLVLEIQENLTNNILGNINKKGKKNTRKKFVTLDFDLASKIESNTIKDHDIEDDINYEENIFKNKKNSKNMKKKIDPKIIKKIIKK